MIREIALVHPDDQEAIRTYDEKLTLYLPKNEFLGDETYVDFRIITTVKADALTGLKRVASLNDDGRLLLRAQLFRFYARKRLPDERVDWLDEGE